MNRREFLRQAALLGISTAVSGLLAGCRSPTEEATITDVMSETAVSHQKGAIIVGLAASTIFTLDPAAYSDRTTETVIRNMFDGLVTRTTDNQIVLELAQEQRQVGDKTIEFDLKRGVKFHNGQELKAEDVVFTFDRILTQEIGAPRRAFVKEIAQVETSGDYTVRFTLNNPWPVFLQLLVHTQIVPQNYLMEVGDEAFAQNPIGCGPFKFVRGKLDEEIVLIRFDDYYGGAEALPPVSPPALDEVIFRMMPDTDGRIAALEAGTVHIIQNVPPNRVPQLVSNPNITVKTAVGTRPKFMEMNVTHSPFNDVRVRQALNYAIDADALLTQVAAGYGITLPGPLSPANLYADPTLEPYGYHPQKATALLAEAGLTPADITFTLDAFEPYVDIATAVASQLQTFGINVTLSPAEYADLKPRLLDCQRQSLIHDWGDSAFDPVGYMEAKWQTYTANTPAGRSNFSCYSNARVDELINIGASEPDPQKRQEIYNEAQHLIYEDAPAVFLYVPQEVEAASTNIRNWQPSPDSRINLHDVWLADEGA